MRLRQKGLIVVPAMLFLFNLLLFLVSAGSPAPASSSPTPKEPDYTQVTAVLQFDKQTFSLGENIIGYFGIINKGQAAVTINTCGYNGPRATRVLVRAVDVAGKPVPDPYVWAMSYGGVGGNMTLAPHTTFWMPFSLPRYCYFTKAGTYTVTAYHDLGWDERYYPDRGNPNARIPSKHRAPIATGTVTLVMPTTAQARAVCAAMAKMPHDGSIYGERGKPFPDFFAMRYPIYLPMLAALARQGDARAIDGLAAIPSQQATSALLRLVDSTHAEVANAAFWSLRERLPSAHELGGGVNMLRGFPEIVWQASQVPELHHAAWTWLASTDRQRIIRGAIVLKDVGTREDLPRLLPVIDRALAATKELPAEQNAYLREETVCWSLRDAADALLRRGASVPDAPKTAAERLCLLRALALRPAYRPAGWQQTAEALLASPIPFVRLTTLESLPVPLEPRFIAPVTTALHSKQISDQYSASTLAARAKAPQFGESVMELLAGTHERFVIDAAYQAATACGVARDRRIDACVRRLDDPPVAVYFYTKLAELTTPWYVSHYSDPLGDSVVDARLKAAWTAFLAAHRDEIRNGAIFDVEKPPFTIDLVPPHTSFYNSKEQRSWPPT